MADVLGYDMGGANTKAVLVTTKGGKLHNIKVAVEYFPIWKQPEKLVGVLLSLRKRLSISRLDALGVTMTAELSDVYNTKREGVHQILSCIKEAFPRETIYVLNINAEVVPIKQAEEQQLSVAAANWAATGWLVAQAVKDCVVVDVGSTSASIIPIVDWQVAAKGNTDLEKLICGELVYTGSLRTNVAAVVHFVPVNKEISGVASELFALSADVHLVLGNITEKQYNCETADGRGKTLPEASARIARIVCADLETLGKEEIVNIAKYIHNQQVIRVAEGLAKVIAYTENLASTKVPVVVTGLGKDFIAKKAAQQIGVETIIDLGTLIQNAPVLATPAFGVALMVARKLEGEIV